MSVSFDEERGLRWSVEDIKRLPDWAAWLIATVVCVVVALSMYIGVSVVSYLTYRSPPPPPCIHSGVYRTYTLKDSEGTPYIEVVCRNGIQNP